MYNRTNQTRSTFKTVRPHLPRFAVVLLLTVVFAVIARIAVIQCLVLMSIGHIWTAGIFAAIAGYIQVRLYVSAARTIWAKLAPRVQVAQAVRKEYPIIVLSEHRDDKRKYR